ncbi:hypothetical protein BOQ62_17160, partial [Chryseobacterium sp. CH21]
FSGIDGTMKIDNDPSPSGQTINVTASGHYYFNGTLWLATGGSGNVNIYNADGTLTANRFVTMNSNVLSFFRN